MKLTKEQEDILTGKQGEILQWAMTCMVKYGNAMEASELIPVSSVHTYIGLPETLARIMSSPRIELNPQRIVKVMELMGALKVRTKTTTSPPPNFKRCSPEIANDSAYYEKNEAVEIARHLGIQTTLTCTPYLVGNVPLKGETCSWLESSAIVYINSILGAHTNRDGVELTLFSALLGLTPKFGLHIDENRKGTHLIDVGCEITSLTDWGALGYFAGQVAGTGVPVFINLKRPTLEEAKQLSAAIATSGGVSLFHIVSVTPEANTLGEALGNKKPPIPYIFNETIKTEIKQKLNYKPEGKVGVIFIGCPHASLAEINDVADLLEGRCTTKETMLWIGADGPTITLAERQGTARVIRQAGGIFIERCPITTSVDISKLERMATNSAKMAHYAVNNLQSKVFFGDIEECLSML